MADLDGFDATEVEPKSGFEPLPAGKYTAVIVGSETKPTRAGTGEYLELVFEILDDEHKGRRLWSRLNLWNPSAKAVEIARAELSSICRAVGLMKPADSAALHNLPLTIHVRCKKHPDSGEIFNEIRGYSPKHAGTNGAPVATASTPPWKR